MDSQDRSQLRRVLVNVVLEVVVLAVLAAVLWFTSMNSLESTQRANAESKLQTAHDRIESAQLTGDDMMRQYDENNQTSTDTTAYFYRRNDVLPARFTAMAQAWGLNGMYIVNGDGGIEQSTEDAPTPDTSSDGWKQMLADGTIYVDGTLHYYASDMGNGSFVVSVDDATDKIAEIAAENDPSTYLDGLHVGEDGFLMALAADGTIAYDPQSELEGTAAVDAFSTVPTNGFGGYLTYNGTEYYTKAALDGDYTIVTMVPKSEFTNNALSKTVVVVVAFAVVSILIVCYSQFLYTDARKRAREGRKATGSFVTLGSKHILDTQLIKKSLPILVVGTIGVFLISWYAQNLISLSQQIVFNDHNAASVEEKLAATEGDADEIHDYYTSEYTRQANAIAHMLAADPRLIDHESLVDLAERDALESIYVFDENGKTVATSTTRYDFALSTDETDQSYGFWDVVKGYETSYVQDVYWSDGTGVTFFIGVPRLDQKGMVEIGLGSTLISDLMNRTSFTSQLDAVPVGNGGFLMAVNGEDNTISYMRDSKYLGKDYTSQGLTAAALSDGYLGYQTINGKSCLVSTVYTQGQYVMVCVPADNIGTGDLPNAIITAILSFVLLLPCILQLVVQRKPSGKASSREAGDGELREQPKGAIDVVTSTGRKTTQSISGRWSGVASTWDEKAPGGKLATIIRGLLLVLNVCLLVYVYAFQSTNSESALSFIVSMQWEKVPNIFSLTYIGVLVLTAVMIVWVIRVVISMLFRNANARLETVGRLFSNFVKYGVWIAVLFYSLSLIGVDSASLWASAGIVTLIVGLGAQSLIKDVIAGIFLVFEGEFRVGDIVTVGGWTGTVLEIGIRTTKIEDGSQNIKILNNSAIADVVNMTKKYSFAVVDLTVSYETPLEKLEALLASELPQVAHRLPKIVAGPFYKGVVSVGGSDLVVRVIAQCTEADRGQLQRDLTRQLLLICDHNDVAPYKGAGEYFEEEVEATAEERKAAAEFVKEQDELAGDVFLGDVKK